MRFRLHLACRLLWLTSRSRRGVTAMKRRDFLKLTTAAAAGTAAAAYIRPSNAQSRKETLLIVSENGPNNLDFMGVGTNLQGSEAAWNTYDRLVTYGLKKDPNGND